MRIIHYLSLIADSFALCNKQTNQKYEDLQHLTNEFDGCYHVFLDVGSNLGNTVRYKPLMKTVVNLCKEVTFCCH